MKLHEAQPSVIFPSLLHEWNYPKISLLPMVSQINTIAFFINPLNAHAAKGNG